MAIIYHFNHPLLLCLANSGLTLGQSEATDTPGSK